MSLLDKTNLLITPNAVKAGKLYSVIPSSGTGDCTVVRNTTATKVNSSGLIESVAANVPRLTYLTVGGNPFLLDEPQRTNSILKSQVIGDSPWLATTGVQFTINSILTLSPDGSNNSTYIQNNSRFNGLRQNFNFIQNQVYTISLFAKANTSTNLLSFFIDTVQYTIGAFTPTLDWARYSFTFTFSFSSIGASVNFAQDRNNGNFGSLWIYGAQIEQGSNATSYIPTQGSAVTRNADVITVSPPIGTVKITTTFSDNTTQVLTTIPALFTVPDGLIKQVLMQNSL